MHRRCKNIDITDIETIKPWVTDCCMRHKHRYDFKKLFIRHGMRERDYDYAIASHKNYMFHLFIGKICLDAIERIENRSLDLPPVQITEKEDKTTGKIRLIGKESAMQQVLDYIAVYSCMDIFKARMVLEQASSIPNRGQVYGKNMIKKWIDKDNDSMRYAEKHGYHYARKCKYFVKLDIRKCYPTAHADIFMNLFKRDCGNKDILWLWEELLNSHKVDGYNGFMIGALPSQWACQYMISFIYRFAKQQGVTRRGKFKRSINHIMMFMDDMLFIGSNRSQIKKTVERTIKYVKENLGWDIKLNWHIRELDKFNIDMMGYVIHADGSVTIRAKTFIRARRMFLRCHDIDNIPIGQARRIMSYKGFFDNSDSGKISEELHIYKIQSKARIAISKHDKEENDEKIYQYKLRWGNAEGNRLPQTG